MSEALILGLLAVIVPLVIFAVLGAIHNAVRVAELRTMVSPMWDQWKEEHKELWKKWLENHRT